MSHYRKQVEEAIQAVSLRPPTGYSWFGKPSPRLSPKVLRSLTPKTARSYLLFNLQSQLYGDFYCRGLAAPSEPTAAGAPAVGRTPFVEELSAANCGAGYWENGWEVRAAVGGRVIVSGGELELCVRPGDCLVRQGESIAAGRRLSLRFPKELLGISPGFYMARGDEALTEDDPQGVLRFYLNLTPDGALRFMGRATRMLNRARLPFNLKVLNDRRGYTRCDAAVLYARKADYGAAAGVLGEIYGDVSAHLKPATPAFTKRLAPGVGLAEDPGAGLSFGEHRCRLLAEGLVRAHERGERSLEGRFGVVSERFVEDGVELEKPYLNPGSEDGYDFRPRRTRPLKKSRGVKPGPPAGPDAETFLWTAGTIAGRLAREAVWHGDRCNWLGAEPVDFSDAGRQPGLSYRALGPELYNGTGGVALFLAELHAVTGDSDARRTALGALGQALSRVEALPESGRLGLFTGAVGIAYAAARAGRVLGEGWLLERAARLLRELAGEGRPAREFDLLGGAAGAVAALVVLRDLLEDESLISFAVRLADGLLEAADESEGGYSWAVPSEPRQRHLTGFSHGAAGVGYALLELFRATGEPKYRGGAERAFEYERRWFDPRAGNWPDFREERRRAGRSGAASSAAPSTFSTFWCHGAPGIALSRLRAFQILKDETCEAEAVAALQTTRRVVRGWLDSGTENYSLCHGLAGNAEVLLHGRRVLGRGAAEDEELVAEVARRGRDAYAKREAPWPCGVGGEETPGLMLGLAGIGYFYLRLYAPHVPSILIL